MQPPPATRNTSARLPMLDCIAASLLSKSIPIMKQFPLALLLWPLVTNAAEWVALPIEEPGSSAAKFLADRASAKSEPPWVFLWVKREAQAPCVGNITGDKKRQQLCFLLGTESFRGETKSVFSWMRRYAINCKERTFSETALKTFDYQNRPISDESYSRYQWEPKTRDIGPDSLPESLFDMFCRSATAPKPAPEKAPRPAPNKEKDV